MHDNILLKSWKTTPKQKKIIHQKNINNFIKQIVINEKLQEDNKTRKSYLNLEIFNINNYMKTKFDLLYENILQGMSSEEKEELGVTPELENDKVENSEVSKDESEMVTISLSKKAFDELKAALDNVDIEDESEDEDFSEEDFSEEDSVEDEDNEVAEDSTFGESIETEEVSEEKGKKLMNKASNKVGGSVTGTPGKSLF